jgi:hypothetical protein
MSGGDGADVPRPGLFWSLFRPGGDVDDGSCPVDRENDDGSCPVDCENEMSCEM